MPTNLELSVGDKGTPKHWRSERNLGDALRVDDIVEWRFSFPGCGRRLDRSRI
jgi:hypothetical protein